MRGLSIFRKYGGDEKSLSISKYIDTNKWRQYLLYWDKIDFPYGGSILSVYIKIKKCPNKDINNINWRKPYKNRNIKAILDYLAIGYGYATVYQGNKYIIHYRKLREDIIDALNKEFKIHVSNKEIRTLCKIRNGKSIRISKNTGKIIMCIFNMIKANSGKYNICGELLQYVRDNKCLM